MGGGRGEDSEGKTEDRIGSFGSHMYTASLWADSTSLTYLGHLFSYITNLSFDLVNLVNS